MRPKVIHQRIQVDDPGHAAGALGEDRAAVAAIGQEVFYLDPSR